MSSESAGRTRASDAEREEFARQVRDAVGEGRLSLDEGDERLAAIYAARFRDELAPLIADLPKEERGTPDDRRQQRRRPGPFLGVRALAFLAVVGLIIWGLASAHVLWLLIPLAFFVFGGFGRACRYRRWAHESRHWARESRRWE